MVRGRAKTESSGRVNLKTVRAIAADRRGFYFRRCAHALGAAVDIGLDFEND